MGGAAQGAPVKRYELRSPGDIIHIDFNKLGRLNRVGHRIAGDRAGQNRNRGVGREFIHVCINDASRVAFTQIKPDENAVRAIDFLKAAVAYLESLGVTVARVMTDNGFCFVSRAFAKAWEKLRLKHIKTKPRTPKTNGKAERFMQTAFHEWSDATAYEFSDQCAEEFPVWMRRYN